MFSLYSTYSEQFSISYIINWDKLILDFSSESAHTSPYSVREARLTFSANGTLEEHGTEAYSEEELEYMHTLATAFHRGIQQEPPVIEEENDTLATVLPDMYPILHYVRNSRISDVFIRSVDNDELEQPESISAYVYYGLDDYLYRTYWGIEAEEHSLEKAGLMRWSTHQDLVFQPSAEFPYPAEFSCPIRGKDLPEEIQAIMSSLPLPKEFTVRQNAPSSWLHGEETKLEDTVLEDS
ncbi:MAG: hypothetical protein Q4P78_03245 [Rothia sp. (in: high G+C Gram-positive bacteria)]|uniref:hypothetical protein n=1 Tax=Rothia sp. (in: high G+C Gram-positive bacteria) TaxID=1885016 RepID=UPI0026DEDB7B|nr:hypothetical protein [Rothia sp. (in: high G+C Gram-positive bacteria)]MDO5750205.1 hypothetical protein [Rothia sp. (in: high G+C Gram-positive bacteria)]